MRKFFLGVGIMYAFMFLFASAIGAIAILISNTSSLGVRLVAFILCGALSLISYAVLKFLLKKFKNNEHMNNMEKNISGTIANKTPLTLQTKKPLIIIASLFIIVSVVILGGQIEKGGSTSSVTPTINEDNTIIDVTKFAKITPEQLVKIMGEPERIDESNYTNPKEKVYPMISYSYNNGDYEFQIIDDKVVEFNIYSSDNTIMPYSDSSSIFSTFGITPSDIILKTADTGVALRYESVTDKIDDFWVASLDSKEKTLEIVKVIYDKTYFGDLPRMAMSNSEESDLQIRCKKGIESILKSPSTAKFPNITKWYIGKDREKIVVQSYVDAQNSFGAEMRSEFQVTFTPSGDTVTSLIFDGVEHIK